MGFFDKVVNFFKAGTPDDSTAAKGRGFKHQKVVVGPRVEAVVMPGGFAGGGVQGLWWYVKRLFTDDDGYVATQFLQETWTPAAADGGSLCPPTLSVFREGPLAVDHREVPTALSDLIWRKLTVVTGDVLPLRD